MRKIVIDPRVIKHLGRDLITSPEVAIIELIKNSKTTDDARNGLMSRFGLDVDQSNATDSCC